MKTRIAAGIVLSLVTQGCGDRERITKLEKQNQDLQSELKDVKASRDYELQGKCSQDAKVWFNDNERADKDTTLLTFYDHYNKKMNKCFVITEEHSRNEYEAAGSWVNIMTLTDVQENTPLGRFWESHTVERQPAYHIEQKVSQCNVNQASCKSLEEFNQLSQEFMRD